MYNEPCSNIFNSRESLIQCFGGTKVICEVPDERKNESMHCFENSLKIVKNVNQLLMMQKNAQKQYTTEIVPLKLSNGFSGNDSTIKEINYLDKCEKRRCA